MKRMFVWFAIAVTIGCITGCTTLKTGSQIGKIETDAMKESGKVILASSGNFKTYWPVTSGFLRGLYEPYPSQDMPPKIQALLGVLDGISARAQSDTWTDQDKGDAIGAIVRLKLEAVKYVAEDRGLTVYNYIQSISGLWGL